MSGDAERRHKVLNQGSHGVALLAASQIGMP